jgi:hypothetical protein
MKWSEEVCPETKGFCTLSKTVEIYINVIADAQTSDRCHYSVTIGNIPELLMLIRNLHHLP